MNSTVLVALITGGFTIVASVVATLLAQRHSSKLADLSMREERRRDVRVLVVELTDTGRHWFRLLEIFIPTLFEQGLKYNQFFSEWVETDSGKRLAAYNATIPRACGELLLMVKDLELRSAISTLLSMHEIYPERVNGKIISSARANKGQADFQTSLDGFAYIRTMQALFLKIQSRSAELLQGDL